MEKLRTHLMTPFNSKTGSGFDSTMQGVRGGNYPNQKSPAPPLCTIQGHPVYARTIGTDALVCIDNNLILCKTLDFLNAAKGVHTTCESSLRSLLARNWKDICSGTVQTYHNNGRHETLLGNSVPAIWTGGTQQFVLLTEPQPVPGIASTYPKIITALPNLPQSNINNYSSKKGAITLETGCPYALNQWLKGNKAEALSVYTQCLRTLQLNGNSSLGPWAGSTGGIAATLDARNTAYFLIMVRAFGRVLSWNNAEKTSVIAITNVLKSFQNTATGSFGAPESNGQALVALGEPRLPHWFGF